MGRTQYRQAHGHASMTRPSHTPVRFVTAGAGAPTNIAGAAIAVDRLVQGPTPFWRVTVKGDIRLTDDLTGFDIAANGTTAPIDGIAQVIREGLTDDVIGVIPPDKKTTQFDVVLLVAGTAVDTAGAKIDIDISHDSI